MIKYYLEQFNARLFPLKRYSFLDQSSKRPLHNGWNEADYTEEQLEQFKANGHGIGWALGPTDLVIDVDAPTEERPEKQGPESLEKLKADTGLDLEGCCCVRSPSGGRHYYLTKPEDVRTRKTHKDYPGIEFLREGCFVVIAGSEHWQGGLYEGHF